MGQQTTELKALSRQQIEELLADIGEPKFRTKQIVQWVYGKDVRSYDQMTNLSKKLRAQLQEAAPLYPARVVDKQVSQDGTRKYVVEFQDGCTAETVAMPYENRMTVCFSTQVGCAMACAFCATGQEGYTRNLLPGEMMDQIAVAENDMGMRVSNLVSMGQGEPMMNYDNVLAALRFANSADGKGIGARHMVISTCGVTKGIERLGQEPEQFVLAVSLHSAIQETRDLIMPKMKGQNLEVLKRSLQRYQQSSGRRVTFEYVLIGGCNDDADHAAALASYCNGLQCNINLIPLNSIDDSPFKPSSKKATQTFVKKLQSAGIEVNIRDSRGSDIAGACGQLKNKMLRGL